MREAHAGGQPPDPRPRREAGIGGPGCRCRTTSAGTTGVIPRLGRGDRRSLPIRVLSSRARQGSAAPTATPRRRAEPAGVLRPPRPASPTAVPASRSPLTRRQRSSRAPTPSAPQHSLKTSVALARRRSYDACNTMSEPASALNARLACSGSPSHWKTLTQALRWHSAIHRTIHSRRGHALQDGVRQLRAVGGAHRVVVTAVLGRQHEEHLQRAVGGDHDLPQVGVLGVPGRASRRARTPSRTGRRRPPPR